MRKKLGILKRSLCALLSVSTILTAIPFTANASDVAEETETSFSVEDEAGDEEGDEPEEPVRVPSKYTFTYSGHVSMTDDAEQIGIVKVPGKGYFIEAEATVITAYFKIDDNYKIAYETDADGQDICAVSATAGGKEIPYSDLNVNENDGEVSISYFFPEDSDNNAILNDIAVTIKTTEKKTFSFSGKCGNINVMTLDSSDPSNMEGLAYVGGKYYYDDRDIKVRFDLAPGYMVATDSEGFEQIEVKCGSAVIESTQYQCSYDEEEFVFSMAFPIRDDSGEYADYENISLKVNFISLKSSYTVSYDSTKMTFDSSGDGNCQGIVYENGKIYLRRDASYISMEFKMKSGYFILEEDGAYQGKVTIGGKAAEDYSITADKEAGTVSFSLTLPTDNKNNFVLGNVVFTPTVVPYRKVTFSANFNHVESILLDSYLIIDEEEEKTFTWLEGEEHEFEVRLQYGFEVKSVKYGTAVLTPDSNGNYRFKVSGAAKVEITTSTNKSAYTVTGDSKLMTLITSDPDALDGCVYEGGKCYIRKDSYSITIPFKVKAGYYAPYDEEYGCQVKVTVKGTEPESYSAYFDEYESILSVSVVFSEGKDGNPDLGDVIITPVFKQYRKVTFSYNSKQVDDIFVKTYGQLDPETNVVQVKEEDTFAFEIEPADGYEVKSVLADSAELKPDEDDLYTAEITKNTTIKITTGKFSGPVLEPVEVKVYYNKKQLTSLPQNITFYQGATYNKADKKYYTNKATTGKYSDIYLRMTMESTDEINKVSYQYGDIKGNCDFSGTPFEKDTYYAGIDKKIVKKAVKAGLPISIYVYVNQPKCKLTFNVPEEYSFCLDLYYPYPSEFSFFTRCLTTTEVMVGDDFYFTVDDSKLRSYVNKKVTCVTVNGRKITPKSDGKDKYYVIRNVKKDSVIEPVIKNATDPDEPEAPDEPEPEEPEDPEDPEQPEEPDTPKEPEFYEIKVTSDNGIASVRLSADGCYVKSSLAEKNTYTYQVPAKSSVTITALSKDKFEVKKILKDGKNLKHKKGTAGFKAAANAEINVSSEGILGLYYKKISDKNASELSYDGKTTLTASPKDIYEFYLKKGNEIVPMNEVKYSKEILKYPAFAVFTQNANSLVVYCEKMPDIKKAIKIGICADALKKPETVSISVYRPIENASLKGFKNNKVKQTAGTSVSYKVSLNKGADYRNLAVSFNKSFEKNAAVTYDPENKTITVETYKNNTLSEGEIHFSLTDKEGKKIGNEYVVSAVPVKLGKISAKLVDVTDSGYSVAIRRPKGTEGVKNLYYKIKIKAPGLVVDESSWLETEDYSNFYEAEEGETIVRFSFLTKLYENEGDREYKIEVYPAQVRDKLDQGGYRITNTATLSAGQSVHLKTAPVMPSYEKKLKLSQKTKAFYHGEKDVALAMPVFSRTTTYRTISKAVITGAAEKDVYSTDDKNSIISIDKTSGLIKLSSSAKLYPGKYMLTAYPEGEGKAASITFTVKAPVTAVGIITDDNKLLKASGKAATKKFKVLCKSVINGKDYKPDAYKVKYTVTSDNEELLKNVVVKNGSVTVKKGYCLDYNETKNRFTVTATVGGVTTSQDFVVTRINK